METFSVQVRRSFMCEVEVEAASAEEAADKVEQVNFPLPPIDDWHGIKDWMFTVYDADGEELLERS